MQMVGAYQFRLLRLQLLVAPVLLKMQLKLSCIKMVYMVKFYCMVMFSFTVRSVQIKFESEKIYENSYDYGNAA